MADQGEDWKEKVKGLLTGINRYNPEIISTLERYIEFQSQGDCYNFEANLVLLKLYQFRPTCINRNIAAQILLKSLMQLPKTDFVMLKCVLAQSLQTDPLIQSILSLHGLLECCQFKKFWLAAVDDVTDTLDKVVLFKQAIKKYICSVLDISYQSIPCSMLREYLGELDDDSIATLIKEYGWSLCQEGGVAVVSIRNQEANIRPKKILAKIEFDNVSGIIAAAR